MQPIDDASSQADIGFRNGSFIAVPVPFSNPMIETGIALGGAYLFQSDEGSNTSMFGVGALKSTNDTEAYGAALSLNFDDNRWGVSASYIDADVRYDLIGNSLTVPVRQTGKLARLDLTYGFTSDTSITLLTRYLETSVTSNNRFFDAMPPEFRPTLGFSTMSYGLALEHDRRDHDLYPTSGYRARLTGLYTEPVTGNSADYSKAFVTFDKFFNVADQGALALRLTGCWASSDTVFYDLCSIGGTDSMRGFNSTQFLDNGLLSTQAEYRGRVGKKLGYVIFAGAGGVGNKIGDLDRYGAAGGVGVRYRLSKKFPVDFSVDVSGNDSGESLLYIYAGQRF
ncbi:BamA/TamA family outer membrane protein [Roseovarius albus]|nr:BamA/TamA family outer membrane protein [Roseovarius albus]